MKWAGLLILLILCSSSALASGVQTLPLFDLPIPEFELPVKAPVANTIRIQASSFVSNTAVSNTEDIIVALKDPEQIWAETNDYDDLDYKNLKTVMRAYLQNSFNLQEYTNLEYRNVFSIEVTQSQRDYLENHPFVEYIENNEIMQATLTTSVPLINATRTWNEKINGYNLTGQGQTICIIDSGIAYDHDAFGNCNPTIQGSTSSDAVSVTSPNYPSNYGTNVLINYTITQPGYKNIAVHFEDFNTEDGYDEIYIYDGAGALLDIYTGALGSFWSVVAEGDTIIVEFYSDNLVVDTGFSINETREVTSLNWSSCQKILGGYNYAHNSYDIDDVHGHGSHVAGIVAGNATVKGVAPEANLYIQQALNNTGYGSVIDIVASIDTCVANAEEYNISVITMSLGGQILYTSSCDVQYTLYKNAINAAVSQNISVIVASGNDGSSTGIAAPACISSAIPVGSTTAADAISSFSNRNSLVRLFAPGSSINSVDADITTGYKILSGTSMATPHVAGAFALMRQYLDAASTPKTPSQIETIFDTTGVTIAEGYSRIDVYDAINSLGENTYNVSVGVSTPTSFNITKFFSVLRTYLVPVQYDQTINSSIFQRTTVDATSYINVNTSSPFYTYTASFNEPINLSTLSYQQIMLADRNFTFGNVTVGDNFSLYAGTEYVILDNNSNSNRTISAHTFEVLVGVISVGQNPSVIITIDGSSATVRQNSFETIGAVSVFAYNITNSNVSLLLGASEYTFPVASIALNCNSYLDFYPVKKNSVNISGVEGCITETDGAGYDAITNISIQIIPKKFDSTFGIPKTEWLFENTTFVPEFLDTISLELNDTYLLLAERESYNTPIITTSFSNITNDTTVSRNISFSASALSQFATSLIVTANGTTLSPTTGSSSSSGSIGNTVSTTVTNYYTFDTTPYINETINITATGTLRGISNTDKYTITVIEYDDDVPIVQFNTPAKNSYSKSGLISFNYSVTDASSYTCVGYQNTTAVSTMNKARFTTNGNKTIVVFCTDANGNVGNRSINVIVDTKKPVTTITLTPNSSWSNTSVTINATIYDTLSGLGSLQYATTSNLTWRTFTDTVITTNTNEYYYFRAIDAAGNTEVPKQVKVQLDVDPPDVTVWRGSQTISSTNVTFIGRVNDSFTQGDSLWLSINNVNYTLPRQSHYLYGGTVAFPSYGTMGFDIIVFGNDTAGNIYSYNLGKINGSILENAPLLSVSLFSSSVVPNNTAVTITALDSLNSSIYDGVTNTSFNGSTVITLEGEGLLNYSIYLENGEESIVENYSYYVDIAAPLIQTQLINNSDVSGKIRAIFNITDYTLNRTSVYVGSNLIYTKQSSGTFASFNITVPVLKSSGAINVTIVHTDFVGNTGMATYFFAVNNSQITTNTSGDLNASTAEILRESIPEELQSVIYSIDGLNVSNVSFEIISNVSVSTLDTVVGMVNITADTAVNSTIILLVPLFDLVNQTAPYDDLTFYVDHGAGFVAVNVSEYIDTIVENEISYARFYILTEDYSVFAWGLIAEEDAPVSPSSESSGGSGGSSSGFFLPQKAIIVSNGSVVDIVPRTTTLITIEGINGSISFNGSVLHFFGTEYTISVNDSAKVDINQDGVADYEVSFELAPGNTYSLFFTKIVSARTNTLSDVILNADSTLETVDVEAYESEDNAQDMKRYDWLTSIYFTVLGIILIVLLIIGGIRFAALSRHNILMKSVPEVRLYIAKNPKKSKTELKKTFVNAGWDEKDFNYVFKHV